MDRQSILIIDDDTGTCQSLTYILTEKGYLPFSVNNGKEAIEAFADRFFNLALIDLKLPDMPGIEVLRKIKELCPDTEAIIITGHASLDTAVEVMHDAVFSYVIKPIDMDYLLTIIAKAMEKQKLEAQLLQAQKMEAVGTLAGGIAHDFNNIIQAISGYTQLLLMHKEADDPEYQKLKAIEHSAQRAAELTKQLLTFSRKVESKLRPVDINHEVEQVCKLLERTIPRMIGMETYLAGDLKIVNADPSQLEQIMMNLAINAKDAMPDGGKLVFQTKNVTLDEEHSERLQIGRRDCVLLSVSDTGCGMDPETVEHIFEPFYTNKEMGKGTGLGLSMVYGIVKNHGGHVTCYSEPDRGSVFRVYFPVLEAEGREQRAEEKKEEKIAGGTETILLVDDDKNLLDLGQDMLGQYGYTTIAAETGEKAVEIYNEIYIIEKRRIDLVILDIGMPGMGGHKCLKKLLGIDPDIKIILSSGYPANGKVKETLESGARDFIGKPYNLKNMLKKVREVLDKK